MNFYDEILKAVEVCLSGINGLVVLDNPPTPVPNSDGVYYPEKRVETSKDVRQNTNPNSPYVTPLWQVLLRPIRTTDLTDTKLIPSVFLRVMGGQRSASGRVGQDGRVRAVVGDITEEYQVAIQGIFRVGFGAEDVVATAAARQIDSSADAIALPLSNQINGFINDLDKCLTPPALRSRLTNNRIEVREAYITDWVSQEAYDATDTEVVTATLSVIINWRRPYVR